MTAYQQEFQETSMDDLVKMLEPVYTRHLSLDEVNKIILFYESPVGKKFASKTSLITQESIQAGQQWGMKVADDFRKKNERKRLLIYCQSGYFYRN